MLKLKFTNNRTQIAPHCPCGKSNRDGKFAPSKEDPSKGYCHSCGETFKGESATPVRTIRTAPIPTSYHSVELMSKSFKNENNRFIKFLKAHFDTNKVDEVAKTYNVGSSKHWNGATIFWQVDDLQRVRYGKVMLYDNNSGKRVKEPYSHFTTVHKLLKLEDFNHRQCLFGLHLLERSSKPIALVESEKTAIIMAIVDDSYLWLATGGKANFTHQMLEPLKGKKVTAFPDCGEILWNQVADRLNQIGFFIEVSKVLEGQQYPAGTDLADVVIQEIKDNPKQRKSDEESTQKQPKTTQQNNPKQPKPYQEYTQLERVKVGLEFKTEELQKLALQIIPNNDSMNERQLLDALATADNLRTQDAKDLIIVMQIKNIITKTNTDQYFLTNSTPY